MPSTKISALTAATTLTGAETIPLVQGGVTKKVTTDQFLTKDASGNVGIGGAPSTGYVFEISKSLMGSTTVYGAMVESTIQSDVTVGATYYRSYANTANAAFTVPYIFHYSATQGAVTGGSRIAPTEQRGFSAESTLTGATSNYGFHGNIPAGAGRWNFYAAGSAANYFGGNVTVGGGGTLGYGAGSGGTVTQATSKSTAVTLNKPSGQITMNAAALPAGSAVAHWCNNTAVAKTDTVSISVVDGVVDRGSYSVFTGCDTGRFGVYLKNESGSSLSEALVLQFNVIKGAIA